MENSGISKAQLARELGVSNAHVANWLSGQMPRAEHLLPISKHFNVTMEWLLCGQDAAPSGPGGPGNAPMYNPGLGAKARIDKSKDLMEKAGHYRTVAARMETDRQEMLDLAATFEDMAQAVLEDEDDFEED
jgi:transcriptional regulator with XRE-family HTH domain